MLDGFDPGDGELDRKRFERYREPLDAIHARIEAATRGGDGERLARSYTAETDVLGRTEPARQILGAGISRKCLVR